MCLAGTSMESMSFVVSGSLLNYRFDLEEDEQTEQKAIRDRHDVFLSAHADITPRHTQGGGDLGTDSDDGGATRFQTIKILFQLFECSKLNTSVNHVKY